MRKMPVMFTASAMQAISPLDGPLSIPHEAEGIVVITARRFDRAGTAAVLGSHVMSPSYLSSTPLEERVAKALRTAGIDLTLDQRLPTALPLPAGLTRSSVAIVVLTLNVELGFSTLNSIGAALRVLREEGLVLVGIADEDPAASGGSEMLASVSLLLAASCEDDRVASLGTRDGGVGFVLLPQLDDAVSDEGCCFWDAEAAGEMPQAVIDRLRPFLVRNEDGENQSMKKKATSSISITRFDKTRLMRLLRSLDAAQENRDEIEDLAQELERGTEVASTEIEPDVVTMNSTVRVTDLDANTTHLYTIVFPSDADVDKGRISILSPLGTALLGYRAGDVVTWEMPRGTRRLRIEELVYQPEAAGDFHL
jgi:regulator of nucleoside diphosphate kinase